ncbi:hypothetical protein [Paraburkholderia fungorum]
MKLASLTCSDPGGAFIVVCHALRRAASAANIAPTMRAVMDNRTSAYPALQALYEVVNRTKAPGASEFELRDCAAQPHEVTKPCSWSHVVYFVEDVKKAGAFLRASGLRRDRPLTIAVSSCVRPANSTLHDRKPV